MDEAEIERVRHHRRDLLHRLALQLERTGDLHGRPSPENLRDALLAALARTDARMLLINLEDLWREERPQNVPGTSAERPNWRRRTRPSLEEIVNSPDLTAFLSRIDQLRRERA
jgi:4-alpha-glucanotransferase